MSIKSRIVRPNTSWCHNSNDRDGKIDLYRWQQIKDPKVAMDDLIDIKTRFIAPTIIHYTKLVFKMIIMDDEGDSNSALTTLNDLNNQESPSGNP